MNELNKSNAQLQYDEYLKEHIANVNKGYQWFKKYLPDLLSEIQYCSELMYFGELNEIIAMHDRSKYRNIPDADSYYELTVEYDPYVEYFYGMETTEEHKQLFDAAWLSHIHSNPHHWQHWVIPRDKVLAMPYVFIIEQILDWWSFSWKSNNLYEIFDWYDEHKSAMILHYSTRNKTEHILALMKDKLDELKEQKDANNC